MAKIEQLDRHVADLIAAGEVVERPASAVKELAENAVDAGATRITVEIADGGLSFLRVTDNGCGIAPGEVRTAFLPHATSKLRTKEDLSRIETMGFRGEALAAISAVSKIDLLTKTEDAPGVSLHLEGGTVTDEAETGCPEGTTMVVRELFYNTPARLKFMKRDSVEGSHVASVLQQQALAHPEIAFHLIKDGETVFRTDGRGDLYAAVYAVLGRQTANEMVKITSKWNGMTVDGFVSKPTSTRGNRANQFFFVNGRPVRSKLLCAALEEAYENQIMTGRFPGCVLRLTLPPEAVDVNVHPAKTEVKFAAEQEVFSCVKFGVLGCLRQTRDRPEFKLPERKTPAPAERPVQNTPAVPESRPKTPDTLILRSPVKQTLPPRQLPGFSKAMAQTPRKPVAPEVAKAFARQMESPAPKPAQQELPLEKAPQFRIVGEVLDTYIIVEQGDGVLFIDKHAAHERILFEKLKANPEQVAAQQLLSPIRAHLTPEETACLEEHKQTLLSLGFDAEDVGGVVLIRQIPANMGAEQAPDALQELVNRLMDGRSADSVHDDLLHTVACKAAIKAGWHTDPREREALVSQVLGRDDIKYCPHGRPVVITLTKQQLERQFKR